MRPNIELSKELLDQVIFGMENQDQIFFLDLDHLKVFSSSELEAMEPGGDLVEIPEWRSVDGYNLMERFVAELKNPLVKLELQQILSSGRGVFRQLQTCLKEDREGEKLWFFYKDRHMKHLVLNGSTAYGKAGVWKPSSRKSSRAKTWCSAILPSGRLRMKRYCKP